MLELKKESESIQTTEELRKIYNNLGINNSERIISPILANQKPDFVEIMYSILISLKQLGSTATNTEIKNVSVKHMCFTFQPEVQQLKTFTTGNGTAKIEN